MNNNAQISAIRVSAFVLSFFSIGLCSCATGPTPTENTAEVAPDVSSKINQIAESTGSDTSLGTGSPNTIIISEEKPNVKALWSILQKGSDGEFHQVAAQAIKENTEKHGFTVPIGATDIDGTTYLWDYSSLAKVTADFAITKIVTFDKKKNRGFRNGAVESDGKNLFVSAEGAFIVFDPNLEEVSRLPLLVSDTKQKNAHDIMIHNDVAYLLDNVVRPIFMFRVDIKDVRNPKIIDKIKVERLNTHLDHQWLDEKTGDWYIHESMGVMSGHGDHVVKWVAGNEFKKATEIKFWEDRCRPSPEKECPKPKGIELHSISRGFPHYAVITNHDTGKSQFATFDNTSKDKAFTKIKTLPYSSKFLGESKNLIWTYGKPNDNQINIYQKGPGLNQVATIDLKDFNLVMASFVHVIE